MNDKESVIFAKVKSWLPKVGTSNTSYRSRSAEKTLVITLLWHTSNAIDKRQGKIWGGWLRPNGKALFTYVVKSRSNLSPSGNQAS